MFITLKHWEKSKCYEEALLEASRNDGWSRNKQRELSTAVWLCMLRHKITGHNHNLLTVNKFFQNVAKFKYIETSATN
jgi:hypothetical protein